jgi:hypothetical protein
MNVEAGGAMKNLPYAAVLALAAVACTATPAQQQSTALYQAAVASGQRPKNVVGVVQSYDSGTGIVRLYDGTTYLIPVSTGGHQMPTDIVGPLVTGDYVRLAYVPEGGQNVVVNVQKESRGDTGERPD